MPIKSIKTDSERLDSYSLDLAYNQYTLGAGRNWKFHNFRKTGGYANQPLDGLWARRPISITARCQPCAICSTRLAPRKNWNSSAIPLGPRSGRAGPWPRRTNGPKRRATA